MNERSVPGLVGLLTPILFFFGRQRNGERVECGHFKFHAASGTLDDLVGHDLFEFERVATFWTIWHVNLLKMRTSNGHKTLA